MNYIISIELENNGQTVLQYINKNKNKIIKYEIVFGINPFFDIIYYLYKTKKVSFIHHNKKYVNTFLYKKNADKYYNNILKYIMETNNCEIV